MPLEGAGALPASGRGALGVAAAGASGVAVVADFSAWAFSSAAALRLASAWAWRSATVSGFAGTGTSDASGAGDSGAAVGCGPGVGRPPGFGADERAPGRGADDGVAAGAVACPVTPAASRAALSLRATGGSMLDDGPLTNSPISLSLASAVLLSTPISAAISCTRGFATVLLSGGPLPGRRGPLVLDGSHFEPLISCPCAVQPVLSDARALGWAASRSRSPPRAAGSSAASLRRARPKARRAIALSMHSMVGWIHAPLPAITARSSRTRELVVGSATIRWRADLGARRRQPTHVLTGSILPPPSGGEEVGSRRRALSRRPRGSSRAGCRSSRP
ncbi:hypothetical protein BFL35_15135 [Clavibacter michiganensis]|nr:hypothetical protein BFL35_15135 [Clavibacter michiganensis]